MVGGEHRLMSLTLRLTAILVAVAAAAFVAYPNPRYTLMSGMQSMSGGI